MGKTGTLSLLHSSVFSSSEHCGDSLVYYEREIAQTTGLHYATTEALFYATDRALAAIGTQLNINFSRYAA